MIWISVLKVFLWSAAMLIAALPDFSPPTWLDDMQSTAADIGTSASTMASWLPYSHFGYALAGMLSALGVALLIFFIRWGIRLSTAGVVKL